MNATHQTGGHHTRTARDVLLLIHHPVHTLSFLQELLRPTAASCVAAAAEMLHVEEDAAAATVSAGRSAYTSATAAWSKTDSGSASVAPLPSLPPPPPSYAAAAAANATPSSDKAMREAESGSSVGPQDSLSASAAAHQPAVPSLTLLLECTTQLSALLAQWRACNAALRREAWPRPPAAPSPSAAAAASGNRKSAGVAPSSPPPPQQPPTRPSAARLLQLMNVILWYCLATADDVRLAYGGRSHGTSGRATPALPGMAAIVAAAGGSQHAAATTSAAVGGTNCNTSSGSRGLRASRSGSSNSSADPMPASDWLGSRMSTTASSAAGVPTVTMSDDQLAEHLFRPVVDAVVLLQDQPSLTAAATAGSGNTNSGGSSKHEEKGGKTHKTPATASAAVAQASEEEEQEDVREELQTVALWMLAAVLVRFADAPFNATVFLPVLFPQVDIRRGSGAAARHPLLRPLLRGDTASTTTTNTNATQTGGRHSGGGVGRHTSLRYGAAAALAALLRKLQPTLQYAEEPHPNRQAFVSLAAQCGTLLLSLHESLRWGFENEVTVATRAARHAAAANNTNTSNDGMTATLLLSTYAVVVGVTPYNRCPRSRAAVLQTLQLPIIRTYLADETCAEYVPTTVLVSSVFKNESMCGGAAALLSGSDAKSSSSSFTVTAGHGDYVDSGDSGKIPAAAAEAAAAAKASSAFLAALLQHADTRVEVWRCMVPLSRLYPRIVHNEFDLLMAASVRVVASLAKWEASEQAEEKAALTAATAKEVAEGEEEEMAAPTTQGATTPRGRQQQLSSPPPPQQQQQRPADPSFTPTPVRANAIRSIHRDPNNDSRQNEGNGASSPCSLQPRMRPPPSTPPEALAECLRTWLHFMGYVWKSFDDNACDPALRPEGQLDRATLAQKQRIHEELLRPAMRLGRCGEEVRTMTLRCIAQIGNDYLSTITDRSLGEELVQYVQVCLADLQPRVRGEALTTLGMWLWQYPSMDGFACVAIDNAVHSLTVDPNALVRTKAAFALSNITGRLPEGTCPTVRDAPDYISTLCATAMHAAVIDSESGVQGHGIRMMNHLLQVLDFEELISEMAGFDEGVAEGFLRVLLECLRARTRSDSHRGDGGANADGASRYAAPREAKHRWNAAHALGMGLARDVVFEAEPKYALEAVDALCTAVVRDHIFKVRTQAAGALGRIPGHCLCALYNAEDLTPRVVRSLCEALETATSTENFRQYKEQGSLHDALRATLAVMITTARPSIELDKVFASYQRLLHKEQLL